jgi:hypothetical protein
LRKQDGTQVTILKQPVSDDKKAWNVYWKSLGQSWRLMPEIDEERQNYLTGQLKIKPDIEQGIYPFKDIDPKLNRADVEWLLSTHDNNHGPVNWNDESQRERDGLDLRGADLREVDLQGLPLARIIAGPRFEGLGEDTEAAIIHLEGTNLGSAHLEKATLFSSHLEDAYLFDAYLGGVNLNAAHLGGANLNAAHLEGTDLGGAHLEGVDLSGAFFDRATELHSIALSNNQYGTASLCDIHWGDVNVAVVNWSTISKVGEENEAIIRTNDSYYRIHAYERAARAYRQLSVVLRNQGLNEHAARFSYRAQLMQRKVFWLQRKFLSYFGSLFLDLLSGYGYKVGRCFIAYALVIGVFATIYHLLGSYPAWNESIVISMTAFHGRGFFPEQFHPGDPQALAAAIEALVGLLIEITLIATLTQRFFGR